MAQKTQIGWTDVTWNPIHGCSKVSPGCAHCYAEQISLRYGHTRLPWTPANAAENVLLKPHKLREPLGRAAPWNEPCMVFVNSMSDLFHELVPFEYIDRVYDVMVRVPQHTFQILTKRPERMRAFFTEREDTPEVPEAERSYLRPALPNVWLGTSIENRRYVGRADALRDTPAAVRFVSAEPLLGPLVYDSDYMEPGTGWRAPCWRDTPVSGEGDRRTVQPTPELDLTGVDWLIVGGESGAGPRPMRAAWARDLLAAARRADTAFFMKQLGASLARELGAAGKGEDPAGWPEDLRVQEWPGT